MKDRETGCQWTVFSAQWLVSHYTSYSCCCCCCCCCC